MGAFDMPLNVRPIAISIAVIFFFIAAVAGAVSGLVPCICCKRAVAGALFGYVLGTFAVKIINAILINVIVTRQINQQKENNSEGRG